MGSINTESSNIEMKDILEIEAALLTALPGTVIEIDGYQDADAAVSDLRLELLDTYAYQQMQDEDLNILRDADVATLYGSGLGDLTLTDMITARAQLIESRERSLDASSAPTRAGANYTYLTQSMSHLHTDQKVQTLYLHRLRLLSGPKNAKPAKGAIPKAKQRLAKELRLPTSLYLHAVKLADGKFKDLRVVKKVTEEQGKKVY